MKRICYSLAACAGILILAFTLTAVGPKRVMAALGYTPVRDVDQPARQPFAVSLSAQSFASGESGRFVDVATVPPGKRLVIETVSAACGVPNGQDVIVSIQATAANQASSTFVPMGFPMSILGNTIEFFSGTQPCRLYADAGTTVRMTFGRNSTTGSGNLIEASLSGHLVDLP